MFKIGAGDGHRPRNDTCSDGEVGRNKQGVQPTHMVMFHCEISDDDGRPRRHGDHGFAAAERGPAPWRDDHSVAADRLERESLVDRDVFVVRAGHYEHSAAVGRHVDALLNGGRDAVAPGVRIDDDGPSAVVGGGEARVSYVTTTRPSPGSRAQSAYWAARSV